MAMLASLKGSQIQGHEFVRRGTEGLQKNLIKYSAQFLNFLVPVALTFSCRFLQECKP
jgi:hypothetical protein